MSSSRGVSVSISRLQHLATPFALLPSAPLTSPVLGSVHNGIIGSAYRHFSDALFAPVLGATPPPPPPMVSLSRGKTQRVLGFFMPDYWSDGGEAFGWIAITPKAIVRANLRDAISTLVHGMAHALDHAPTTAKGKKMLYAVA